MKIKKLETFTKPYVSFVKITIEDGYYLTWEDMDVVLSTTSGNSVDIDWNLPELNSFSIDKQPYLFWPL